MRICALALIALGMSMGCRGAQSPDVADPEPLLVQAEPVEPDSEPEPLPTRVEVSTTAPVSVLGSPRPAAAAGWEPETEPRCPESTDELPISTAERNDRRLKRRHLVVVSKTDRRLWLFESGQAAGCWQVGLGFSPEGDKEREGDGRTPEGWYRTSDKPWSTFDNAIAIHYPNRDDAKRAVARGDIGRGTLRRIEDALTRGTVPPQRTAMGGAVLIHGGGSASDWTLGCVALDDADLVELRSRLPAGKRVDLLVLP